MISKEKINKFIFDKKGWIPLSFMVIFVLCIAFAPTITTILLTALFVAYAIDPMVTFLSKKIKLGRSFSSGLVIFLIVVLILLLLLIVLPGIFRQLYSAFGNFDSMVASIWEWMENTAREFNIDLSRYLSKDELVGRLESVAGPVAHSASYLVKLVFEQGFGLLSFIFNFAIFIIMTFFMSSRYPHIKVSIFELIPLNKQELAKTWLSKFDFILSGFIRGQITVCFILGCIYAGSFAVAGISNAGSLGAMIGMLCIVPYVGLFTGIIISLLLALLTGGVSAMIKVILIFVIVQSFDTVMITPNIMGKKVGINPVFVIIAIFAGAEIGGFLGVLIAVPTFAILKLLVDEMLIRYKSSSFYNEEEK